MKVATGVLLMVAASAQAAPGSLQQLVDGIFEKYLPASKGQACPFVKIDEQCGLFNATLEESKACHMECGHGDFRCHLKCPRAKPTSVQELREVGEAMLCHKACGRDRACHATACSCPFAKKRAACSNLAEVVECHKRGGNHQTCRLDAGAKELLLREPWSLALDVANHLVDHVLLPLPADQQASQEEVHSCHMRCGPDHGCHKACPSGPYGILKDHCEALNTTKACHQSCEAQAIKCPFKKMECHLSCPMSMPSSAEELKVLADHMACHTECGRDEQCHQSCPMPLLWAEREGKCAEYEKMVSCHKSCHSRGHGHSCHQQCPSWAQLLTGPAAKSLASPPGTLIKQVASQLLV